MRLRTRAAGAWALWGSLVAGCAANRPAAMAPVFFPPPPDTARFQFLTRFSGAVDFPGGAPSWIDRVTGRREERPEIRKPFGIAGAPGRLCITDIRLPGLALVDLREQRFRQFQPLDGPVATPASCLVDSDNGRLLVADAGAGRIMVFDSTLAFVTSFGAADSARPAGLALAGDRIYVSDLGLHRVRVFDRRTYALLAAFPTVERGSPEYLAEPAHLAVGDGRVYVSDGLAFTIKVFDLEGSFVRTIGAQGRGPGQFARPKGVAVDRAGHVYAVDAAFQNVQVFDREGRLLTFFGGGYRGPGYLYLPIAVAVDYENLEYFRRYVDPRFSLKHLIYVTNQFGPDKVTVYGYVERRNAPTTDQ